MVLSSCIWVTTNQRQDRLYLIEITKTKLRKYTIPHFLPIADGILSFLVKSILAKLPPGHAKLSMVLFVYERHKEYDVLTFLSSLKQQFFCHFQVKCSPRRRLSTLTIWTRPDRTGRGVVRLKRVQ